MTDGPLGWLQGFWRWLKEATKTRTGAPTGFAGAVSTDIQRAFESPSFEVERPPMDFFEAARFGFAHKVRSYLLRGADVNARDPRTKGTVLHHAASSGDLETLEAILQVRGVDTLVQDQLGRLAYDLCTDPELGNRLLQVHHAQAQERGIRLKTLM